MAGISQQGQREREREIANWGEREIRKMRTENGMGF
jgi:hypothetical protein